MSRKIIIEFEYLGRFIAELLEKEAPNICDAVWKNLPLEGTIMHARFAGLEIAAFFPQVEAPMENIRDKVSCGDVGFYNLYWECPAPELSADMKGEICFFYADMTMKHTVPPAIFARIKEDLEDLKTVGKRIFLKGPEKIFIERKE